MVGRDDLDGYETGNCVNLNTLNNRRQKDYLGLSEYHAYYLSYILAFIVHL